MTEYIGIRDIDNIDSAKLVRLRHPGQWVSAAVLLVLLAMLAHTLLTNPRFQWHVVWRYFTTAPILPGCVLTLWLTAAVMVVRISARHRARGHATVRATPILRSVSFGYVWLIRSVPPLVQLLFWYELASLYPELSLGIPFGPAFVTVKTAHLFTGLLAAFVGADAGRGRVLGGDHPRRPAVRRARADEAAQALGLRPLADLPPDRAAAGDAGDRAGLRQHADRHAQGDVDRERDRRAGPAVLGAADLQPELPDHPAAAGRDDLVRHR